MLSGPLLIYWYAWVIPKIFLSLISPEENNEEAQFKDGNSHCFSLLRQFNSLIAKNNSLLFSLRSETRSRIHAYCGDRGIVMAAWEVKALRPVFSLLAGIRHGEWFALDCIHHTTF
jgi:hypothetical protein